MPGYSFFKIACNPELKNAKTVLATLEEHVALGLSLSAPTVSDIVYLTIFNTTEEKKLLYLAELGFKKHGADGLTDKAVQYKKFLEYINERQRLLYTPALR
jgi:hypothetical protein